jgi:hypothetical protein
MIHDTLENARGDIQTRRTRLGENLPRRAADAPGAVHMDVDETYPGELMLVGDPRPQRE